MATQFTGRIARVEIPSNPTGVVCAVGPNGEASEILPYDLMPSNNVLRSKIAATVRGLVARVEGAQARTAEGMLQ